MTQGLVDKQALYGYLGTMVGAGTTAAMDSAIQSHNQGYLSGGVSLASSAISEGVQYGVSLGTTADSHRGMSFGDIVKTALGSMGGITINVADLGAKGAPMSLGTGGISLTGNLYQLGVGLRTQHWAQQEAQKLATLASSVCQRPPITLTISW